MKESNATLNGEISTYNGLLQSGGSLNNQSNSLGMADFAPIGSDGFSDLTASSEMDTMSMRATVSSSDHSYEIYYLTSHFKFLFCWKWLTKTSMVH